MTQPRLLLDVNVWLALFDERHAHHATACKLLASPQVKIATCPLTENGVFRILSMPSYFLGRLTFQQIRETLQLVCAQVDHEFWPDDLSLRTDDVLEWSRMTGHNQITDAYLLALAVKHGGSLASFDQKIGLSSVKNANPQHLVVL
jgi:toxin-antitoxin system PIN domain toxin